jgi:acetoin utilization deacetylase AcuC-like enzyme
MKILHSDAHRAHIVGQVFDMGGVRESRDAPERVDLLLQAAQRHGEVRGPSKDHGSAPLAAVHTPEYLDFLTVAFDEWTKLKPRGEKLFGHVFPVRSRNAGYPTSIIGRAGYHMHDQLAPIGPGTWRAVKASANLAADAAHHLLDGDPVVYALCRPSGHHASRDMGGGATYLNNAAIAAQVLRSRYARVALIDVDVHHGNGTQEIFYDRDDVLFVSLHRDPIDYHPYFFGHACERGEGAGLGYTLNLPLAAGADDDAYLATLGEAIKRILLFSPEALVVSLGLDGHKDDPSQGLSLTYAGFERIGAALAGLSLPTVLVQEGGYNLDHLAGSLDGFLTGFKARHRLRG